MSTIKSIIWDFDGVIIFSEEVRVMGFRILFENFTDDKVDELINFHKLNGGLSRYVKIRFFYEKVLKESISDGQVQTLAMKFSKIMRKELTNRKLLNPQWLDLMKEIKHSYVHHIASGSDGDELRFLCSELGIAHYFKSIEGSPTPKKRLVEGILEVNSYSKKEACLIGDAINDWEAASHNSIHFFGYRNDILRDKGYYLDQLSDIKECLK